MKVGVGVYGTESYPKLTLVIFVIGNIDDFYMLHSRVVDKTRISATSKIWPFHNTLIAHVESGQILLITGILVLSTTTN